MRIKLRRKLKYGTPFDLDNKVQQVGEIKDALNFLNPELSEADVIEELIQYLIVATDEERLTEVWKKINALANKKVDEVTDLYCNFFSETTSDNNN
jgi:hypothetical protein